MPAVKNDFVPTSYWSIKAGRITQKAVEGQEGAKLRKWEMKDGTKGEVWELQEESWKGKILSVRIRDTEYGQQCSIRFEDATISMPTNNQFFSSFAEKLPNIDLSKEVIFRPYNEYLNKKTGKNVKGGVSLIQDGEKIKSAYKEYSEDGKLKTYKGYPIVDDKKKNKTGYWKIYYSEVAMFLCDEIEKMTLANEIARDLGGELVYEEDHSQDPIRAEDIAF